MATPSNELWAIRHPPKGREVVPRYSVELADTARHAWSRFIRRPTCELHTSSFEERVAESEAKGYRAVRVRIVEVSNVVV